MAVIGRKMFYLVRLYCNTKVHLDDENQAYGVTYYRHGIMKFARARKEIILSAGSVMSPKILMNSGIGPTHHLQEVGVLQDTL